jgi:membrane-bound metal-dependent hydrolase YbcI (DUF457 family)
MDFQIIERVYNWAEVVLWGAIAVVCLIRALTHKGIKRCLLAVAAVSFAIFAVTDVLEVESGAWWEPPWLLALKVACVASVLLVWREWHRRFRPVDGANSRP